MTDFILVDHKAACVDMPMQSVPVKAGSTVDDIIREFHGTYDGVQAWVKDGDQWREIPPERCHLIRPKQDHALRFYHRLHGGGDRNLFGTIAAIALAIAAPGIGQSIALGLSSAGVFFTSASAFALTSAVASGAVLVGGTLVLQRLFPSGALSQRSAALSEANAGTFEDVESDANVSAKGAYLPVVVSSGRRISPPDIMQPHAYIESGIQTVDRCLALKGKHSISEIQVDGTSVSSISEITTQIRDGDEASAGLSLVTKITTPVQVSQQLSTFQLDADLLEDQSTQSNSEPRWHYFSTTYDAKMEEIALRLQFDSFATATSASQKVRIPIRLSCRAKGETTWFDFPEFHIIGRDTATFVRDVRIRWDSDFGTQEIDGEIEYDVFHEVTEEQTTISVPSGGLQWDANAHFDGGGGIGDVDFIFPKRFGFQIELTESVLPKAEYEWRIQRGLALNSGALNSSYQISGTIESLFYSKLDAGEWKVPVSQGDFLAQVTVQQATVIVDEIPSQDPTAAQIALKTQGQSVKNITAKAAKFVDDYNDGYFVLEADMSQLTAGGDDWITNTITGLRFDMSEVLADGNFVFDFIEITDDKGNVGYSDYFDSVGNWTAGNGSLSVSNGEMTLAVSANDPKIQNTTDINFDGSIYYKIRLGVKKVDAGQCSNWHGAVFYQTAGHGESGSYVNSFAEPGNWDALGWTYHISTSDNPASHYRQILYDFLTEKGIDTDLIDDTAFIAWRTECANRGYKVSGVFAGEAVDEVLYEIAVAGFARPIDSDVYSIDYFRDRSSEVPVQTFSPRNTESIEANISFADRPRGFRIDFNDKDTDWKENEIFQSINNASDVSVFEPIEYRGIDDETLVRRRAVFDLLQVHERRRQWIIKTSIEGVICEIGDLVSLVTDIFGEPEWGARIRSVNSTTEIVVDQVLPAHTNVPNFGDVTKPTVAQILDAGKDRVSFIATPTAVEQVTVTNSVAGTSGTTLTLSPALSSTDDVGQHINIMPSNRAIHRVIITGIEREGDDQAIITAVDEAPQIYEMIEAEFG